jgi:hypothetical protein
VKSTFGIVIIVLGFFEIRFHNRAEDKKTEVQKQKWFEENDGKAIIFFPCKVTVQKAIFRNLTTYIDSEIELAYYDGSTVVCTLEPSPAHYILKNAYNSDHGFQLGTPSLLVISNCDFELKTDLSELKNAKDVDFDFEKIIKEINENS